nr:MAG: major capsid protein [Microviridae sp.]
MHNKQIFQRTGSLQPGKSVFDLSYEKKFDCDMGQLIPVMCDEVVPGDFLNIGNEAIIRFQPLVAPVLHEVNVYVHYFFVPYRILWKNASPDNWEDFITGGADGSLAPTIPTWNPTNIAKGSLWDYFGLPLVVPTGCLPLDFMRRAYNRIYNEYYRDENLTTPIAETLEIIQNRAWEKDYFTSALPWQQRGTAPALPITGTSSAVWPDTDFLTTNLGANALYTHDTIVNSKGYVHTTSGDGTAVGRTNMVNLFNHNTVNLGLATTFNVADLRLAFQIQKFLERNARAGARYTEFLTAHFGVSPRDDRLQRPEYIGGSKASVVVSEVLQTSQTGTTPQGNMAGHGLSVDRSYCGHYHAKEFGLIMGIMSVMPRTAYSQGINRQWLRRTKYDFYFPEFANLSEQAIQNAELYATAVQATNQAIFGYQGRYDEMRTKDTLFCNDMRDTFDYWHLGRIFSSQPALNTTFVTCVPRKDIFAVPSSPGLIVNFGNNIKAIRPLPVSAEPGLIDHH